jgi:hypothetical protein
LFFHHFVAQTIKFHFSQSPKSHLPEASRAVKVIRLPLAFCTGIA